MNKTGQKEVYFVGHSEGATAGNIRTAWSKTINVYDI